MKKVSSIVFGVLMMGLLVGCSTPAAPSDVNEKAEEAIDAVVAEIKDEVAEVEEVKEEEIKVEEVVVDADAAVKGTTKVLIKTSMGDMEAVLYDSTPGHRDNFVKLVKEGFYDDLLFHRVIEGFMIQGGDPQSRNAKPDTRLGTGGPGYQIPAEIGAPHIKGTLAAARNNNPEKQSSGSQFYIVHGNIENEAALKSAAISKGLTYSDADIEAYTTVGGTSMLDGEYTVFGEVTMGLDVIDTIAATETAPSDRPVEDVTMNISLISES